ncbi:phosphonate ABC transporter, permease protein PhnE [Radiobacillus deserti]|uniref:Phosphonate ABC transporter, permease protein PhnE n=1 Tax=Radiobacillus deserti TaxID=2594883 RepID=A0A516KK67_9BACI|nr:phosphonate ABC transporter, permease protein PhnE [Radiobacillus deserti]QDP41789.1 phosphonate ABC transporter, permease protein PhnE [Radiobacillus deserti]
MSSTTIPTKPKKRVFLRWIVGILLAFIYIWAFSGVPMEGFKETAGQVSKAIMSGLFHPDWDYVYLPEGEDLLRGLLDTLAIAVLGTFISAFLCIPFAFWAANNMTKGVALTGVGKFMLSFIRTFPELVMALLFIKVVGPGSFAGVLALGLHSIGMLGKLFSEEIENIDLGPSEALTATGASRMQTLWFAVIPQVLPGFLSYTLYRFEINLRAATILGIIGAGGIGTPLIFALQSRDWERVGVILLGIIVMVSIVDVISGYLRKKVV